MRRGEEDACAGQDCRQRQKSAIDALRRIFAYIRKKASRWFLTLSV